MSDHDTARRVSVHVVVRNTDNASLRLIVEPWAEEFDIAPDSAFVVHFDGPEEPRLELEVRPNGLTVWGWQETAFWLDADPREVS